MSDGGRKIYVGNLPNDIHEDEIRDLFRKVYYLIILIVW